MAILLRIRLAGLALLFPLLSCMVADAQSVSRPDQHPWGRFEPGSWKRVRAHEKEFDADGNVERSTTTETKMTLIRKNDERYVLRVDVKLEVAGRVLLAQSRLVERGYLGETSSQKVTTRMAGKETVDINGRKFVSQVQDVVIRDDARLTKSRIYLSPRAPFILRRETTVTDADNDRMCWRTKVETLATQMPCRVAGYSKTASHVRTVHHENGHETVTLEKHCDDIPGEVISQTAKEMNGKGRVVRESTLELLGYRAVRQSNEGGILRRRFEQRTFDR